MINEAIHRECHLKMGEVDKTIRVGSFWIENLKIDKKLDSNTILFVDDERYERLNEAMFLFGYSIYKKGQMWEKRHKQYKIFFHILSLENNFVHTKWESHKNNEKRKIKIKVSKRIHEVLVVFYDGHDDDK